jgi:hypothetical protein
MKIILEFKERKMLHTIQFRIFYRPVSCLRMQSVKSYNDFSSQCDNIDGGYRGEESVGYDSEPKSLNLQKYKENYTLNRYMFYYFCQIVLQRLHKKNDVGMICSTHEVRNSYTISVEKPEVKRPRVRN